MRSTLATLAGAAMLASAQQPAIVIGNFEGKNHGDWTVNGDAFGRRAGVEAKGTLLSPEFELRRMFINFLIAGSRDLASVLGAELLVDDRVVRASSATEARGDSALHWRTWDVADLAGKRARIRVNDNSSTGALTVDRFEQSDERRTVPTDATTLFRETHRPQFHFTARTGWLNDANGMLYCKGRWHLFHQHRPPDSPATVWGHAVSEDLLHWRHLPTAIPNEGKDAIFSGSGLVDAENASGLRAGDDAPLLFFYTLHQASDSGRKATQCMAYSTDGGVTFRKFAGNPVLSTRDTHDRDPKVFWHAPTRAWLMVLSLSRNNTDRDHATYGLFRSRDIKSWELLQEIGPGAWYWECPDMFELPLDGDRSRMKWLLVKGSGDYIVGAFDGRAFKPETEPIRTHWGGCYYGAQTFNDAPGGRRIQIGWMSTGKAAAPNAYPGMPFNQQMSFPRELTLRTTPDGPRVFRLPIAEIEKLYTKTHDAKPGLLQSGENPLADIRHDLLDIEMEIELMQTQQVKLNLRGEEVVYDVKDAKLKAFGRALALAPLDGKLTLRVLLDRTSIELFANHGAVTHSGVFFPDPALKTVSLTVSGGAARIRRLATRELQSVLEGATP